MSSSTTSASHCWPTSDCLTWRHLKARHTGRPQSVGPFGGVPLSFCEMTLLPPINVIYTLWGVSCSRYVVHPQSNVGWYAPRLLNCRFFLDDFHTGTFVKTSPSYFKSSKVIILAAHRTRNSMSVCGNSWFSVGTNYQNPGLPFIAYNVT